MRKPFALAVLVSFASALFLRADTTWDWISNTQWYVPAANTLAYLAPSGNFSTPLAIGDQTVWNLGTCTNGVFTGSSSAILNILGNPSSSSSGMSGLVTGDGQIRIVFTQTNSSGSAVETVGIGQMRSVESGTAMEMQMITGTGDDYVTHWAYMEQTPDGFTPSMPDPPQGLADPEWSWMGGTTWTLQSDALFGVGGMGAFTLDDYENGYFWGSGSGPDGTPGETFTLMGSATPEGDVLFCAMAGDVLTNLTGQISGDASDGQMILRPYDGADFGTPGYASVVPEPATWLLLAAGGLLVLRVLNKRRHHRTALSARPYSRLSQTSSSP